MLTSNSDYQDAFVSLNSFFKPQGNKDWGRVQLADAYSFHVNKAV